jgi:CRP-like cAMP-binding protein
MLTNVLFSTAEALGLVAYSCKKMLHLRILLLFVSSGWIVGSLAAGLGEAGMMSTFCWSILYALVNSYHLTRLMMERKPILLPKDTAAIYNGFFSQVFTTREFKSLFAMAKTKKTSSSSTIIEHGSTVDILGLLVHGGASVQLDKERTIRLQPGQFMGEMSFLSNGPASADIIIDNQAKYLFWDKDDIRALEAKPSTKELYGKLMQMVSQDIVNKLVNTTNMVGV